MSTEKLKLITAYIHPLLEARVVRALHELPEFPGFLDGGGPRSGSRTGCRGHFISRASPIFSISAISKCRSCAPEAAVERISKVLAEAAWTGRKGDGVLFVTPVDNLMRIREAGKPKASEAAQ